MKSRIFTGCIFRCAVAALTITGLLSSTGTATAESIIVNGGSCVPFPNSGPNSTEVTQFRNLLFAFGQSATCHFDLREDTRADELSFAVVDGTVARGGTMQLRLCTYPVGSTRSSCGPVEIFNSSTLVALLEPPSGSSFSPFGVFVTANFLGGLSTIRNIVVAFNP